MNDDFSSDPNQAPLDPYFAGPEPTQSGVGQLPVPVPCRRGHPLIAWIVIVLLTICAALAQEMRKESDAGVAQNEKIGLVMSKLQARLLVGAARTLPQSESGFYQQAGALNTGPVLQRLCFIAVAAELAGPEEALSQLAELSKKTAEHGIPLTPQEVDLQRILPRLYYDYMQLRFRAPSVSQADRVRLREALGWFGQLALVPDHIPPTWQVVLSLNMGPELAGPAATILRALPYVAVEAQRQAEPGYAEARDQALAPARQTFWTMAGTLTAGIICSVAGLAGLVVMLILLFQHKLRGGLRCGSLHGGIYAETFALWMLAFMGLEVAADYLPTAMPRLPVLGLAILLSLAVLAWPVLRGISWRQVREDIGWIKGRDWVPEPLVGAACYGMALPLLAVGVFLMLLLLALQHTLSGGSTGVDNFGPTSGAGHPIVLAVANADWWTRFQVLLLVAVFAPVIEETMFRGILYRHLREATCLARPVLSVLFSATVVSFVFAVIHPQGITAVPPLMALAFSFCLMREWRGSLIGPMVAHGIHNGLLMLILMLMLGG
jgi:membrane protease YdiL (CAAX protease family)